MRLTLIVSRIITMVIKNCSIRVSFSKEHEKLPAYIFWHLR